MDKEKLLNSEIEIQVIEIFSNSHKTSYGQKILTRGLPEVAKRCSLTEIPDETDYRIKTYDIISDWKKILIKDLPKDLIAEILSSTESLESYKIRKELIDERYRKLEEVFKSFYENFSLSEHGKIFYIEDDNEEYYYYVLIKKDSEIEFDSLSKEGIIKMMDEDPRGFEHSKFEEITSGDIIEELARKYHQSLIDNNEQKIIVISDYLH